MYHQVYKYINLHSADHNAYKVFKNVYLYKYFGDKDNFNLQEIKAN